VSQEVLILEFSTNWLVSFHGSMAGEPPWLISHEHEIIKIALLLPIFFDGLACKPGRKQLLPSFSQISDCTTRNIVVEF